MTENLLATEDGTAILHPRQLSVFERKVWTAWIIQQIVAAGYPKKDWSQVNTRVALDYLANTPNTQHDKRLALSKEDQSHKEYVNFFLNQAKGLRGLSLLKNSTKVDQCARFVKKNENNIQITATITHFLIALLIESPEKASLTLARNLCRTTLDCGVSTAQRAWTQFGSAAHLVGAIALVYRGLSPLALLESGQSMTRRSRYDDVTEIILVARAIKAKLEELSPDRSLFPLGKNNSVEKMADPSHSPLWNLSTALQQRMIFAGAHHIYTPLTLKEIKTANLIRKDFRKPLTIRSGG